MSRFGFLLLVLMAGCSLFGTDGTVLRGSGVRASTDGVVRLEEAHEVLDMAVENHSESILRFSTCLSVRIEELDGERVLGACGFPVCECVCMVDLGPRRVGRRQVYPEAGTPLSGSFTWEEGRRYRVRLDFLSGDETSQRLLDEPVYTAPFRLVKRQAYR